MELFFQQLGNGIAVGATYAMFAMGFGLVFATMGILNVAHGTFATWGAIAALWAVEDGWPFPLAVAVGVVGAGAIGFLVDALAFEPIRKRDVGLLGSIITSIGAWIILGNLAQQATDAQAKAYPPDTFARGTLSFGPVDLAYAQVLNIVVALVVGVVLYQFINATRTGAAIRGVGHGAHSAALAGVNTRFIVGLTAFLAAAIAGLAGVLSALATNNVSFTMGEGLLLKGFAAVVVGGFGDIRGALAGGFLIGIVEVLGAQYISTSFRDAITFGLLLVVLLVRPHGIFGEVQFQRA